MRREVDNRNRDSNFYGPYAGRDLYITMFKESERDFVVTHNANIKPVSYFIGRETELQELRQRIEEGRKSVLVSGMGGIGKTHICRKLFEEYLNKHAKGENIPFCHIGYIEYNGDMGSSLQNCLKFKEQDNPEQNQAAAWKELEYLASGGKLLLFVDNVNVPVREDAGLGKLKSIPGAIVLTSRRTSFSKEFEPFKVGFLSTEQCKKIYERIRYKDNGKKMPDEDVPDLEYIIESMAAGHTITVEFLANLAYTKSWSAKRLHEELQNNGFRLRYKDEEDKLVNIQKSYEVLYDMSALTKAEQNILEAFSVFPYIPLAAETCNEWLLADAGVSEDDDILMGLYQKGWLQLDVEQESYALHPVFAKFIYDKCSPKQEEHQGLIEACRKCLEIPLNGFALERQKFIPFAESLARKLSGEQVGIMSVLAYFLQYLGEYHKAEQLCREALQTHMRMFGEKHLSTADSYNNLAFVCDSQGKYKEAEELYRKSLKIREKELGKEHPSTAIVYNNLAGTCDRQEKYREAEDLYKKALHINEKELGRHHPYTAIIYNNLGYLYWNQGRYQEAEELYRKSLEIREKVFGNEHPSAAMVYNNLGKVYAFRGKYKIAEKLYRKSLQIHERVFGKWHPDTAISYNNLAGLYNSRGQYKEAERLCKRGVQIREKVFGNRHPDTAVSYNNLAEIYENQGKYKKAEELYRKSLEIREKVFGKWHMETADSYNNLAGLYGKQGKYKEAEELYKKALLTKEKVLGESHPHTVAGYNNLSLVYEKQKEYKKAMAYYLKAYKYLVFKLGLSHPHVKMVYDNMKRAYYNWNPKGDFKQWLEKKMRE